MSSFTVDLQSLVEELEVERHRLREAEAAYVEGRVADGRLWLSSLERRQERVRQLELLRDELVALEESAAELAEDYRQETRS